MPRHRFRDLVEVVAEPAAAVRPTPVGFVACPVALQPWLSGAAGPWQQQLYQWAYEQARGVLRPSVHEGRLAPSVN
jgi:hypothetical protein